MEHSLTVNEMLKETITKIDHNLIPPGFVGNDPTASLIQETLSKMIDVIGEESAKAQKLGTTITTGKRFRSSPTHILYLLKDPCANINTGRVIGILKVARKELFLYHPNGEWKKSSPVCVLDFYITPDYQRQGLGKKLFDYMLTDTNLVAYEVAIDFPSKKMEQFLKKNYNLNNLVRQNNNFAVPQEYFGANPTSGKFERLASPHVFGRYAARKHTSQVASIIHGSNWDDNTDPPTRITRPGSDANVPSISPKVELTTEQNSENSSPNRLPAGCRTKHRPSQVTDKGYLDLKYYHNKLW